VYAVTGSLSMQYATRWQNWGSKVLRARIAPCPGAKEVCT
jgi:hypothetical protein